MNRHKQIEVGDTKNRKRKTNSLVMINKEMRTKMRKNKLLANKMIIII